MSNERSALEGLVVVDLSTTLTSAYTTMVFADYGAEVIQVERPGGSELRRMPSWPFWMRGKKSIVLDLKDSSDREVATGLATGADVVVDGFGSGAADRLGLGYDALAAVNPRLVYTSITGFGHTGPYSHLKGYEAVVQAKTGSMYGNVAPNRSPDEPVMLVPLGATISAALLALQGTFIALHERERTGFGQRVDATMIQGMMGQDPWAHLTKALAMRYPDAFTPIGVPTTARRTPLSWLSFGLMNGYTKDGRWLQFAHSTFRLFDAFIRALGLEELRSQPEWKDAADSDDDAKRDTWWTMMLERVRARSTDEWQAVFDAETNVFAEVYRTPEELYDHPQIVHDNHAVEVDVPGLGKVREMSVLVKLSETPGTATKTPPAVDQHGEELRRRPTPEPAPSRPVAEAPRTLPLEGVTIVDLGTFYAGPFASAMLADHGATVIHVEALEGDPIRFQMPVPESSGVRVTQGKKSVAVDAFSEKGRRVVIELVGKADVVLHTYRGGVAERMGVDAETMVQQYPNLVYHHGVGYGIDGPYARKAALAPTIAAGSGWARRCGGGGPEGAELTMDEIKDATVKMGGAQAGHPDGIAAMTVAAAMMLGLYARDRGAGGQVTLTSMISTMGHALGDVIVQYDGVPSAPVPDPEYYGYAALYRLYRASDAWIVLCAPREDDWQALVGALPDAGLAGDARFAAPAARAEHDAELISVLTKVFATRTAGEWERELSAAGLGCAEVVPHLGGLGMGLFEPGGVGDELGLLTTVNHPLWDETVRAVQMVKLGRGESSLGAGVTIGQHTDEVLRDLLGYDEDRIAKLRADGIIGG